MSFEIGEFFVEWCDLVGVGFGLFEVVDLLLYVVDRGVCVLGFFVWVVFVFDLWVNVVCCGEVLLYVVEGDRREVQVV